MLLEDMTEEIARQAQVDALNARIDDTNADIGMIWEKQYLIDGLPFYSISAPLITSRPYYTKSGDTWVEGPEKPSTAPIPCPRYLMVYPKYTGTAKNLYLYVGDMVNGQFAADQTVELVVTAGGYVNYIRKGYLFRTYD